MSASVKSKSVEFVGKTTAVTMEMLTPSHSLKRGSNQLDCFLYLTKRVKSGSTETWSGSQTHSAVEDLRFQVSQLDKSSFHSFERSVLTPGTRNTSDNPYSCS